MYGEPLDAPTHEGWWAFEGRWSVNPASLPLWQDAKKVTYDERWDQLCFDAEDAYGEIVPHPVNDLVGKWWPLVLPWDAPAAPHPDWSQAPEWATWWAVDADGEMWWYEFEPIVYQSTFCGWDALTKNGVAIGRRWKGDPIDIPLGIDWRTLKQQRPQPATGGDDAATQTRDLSDLGQFEEWVSTSQEARSESQTQRRRARAGLQSVAGRGDRTKDGT